MKKYFLITLVLFFSCSRNPEKHLKEGNKYFSQNKFYEAINSYNKAIMLKNKFPEAITLRALAYEKLNQKQKALEEYKKAILVDPKYIVSYNNLASMLIDLGKYNEAIYYLNEALKINPDYYYALYSYGLCLYYTKDYYNAKRYFSKAVDVKSTDTALYYLAMTDYHLKNYKDALFLLKEVFDRNPNSDLLAFEIGKINYELDNKSSIYFLNLATQLKEKSIYFYYKALAEKKFGDINLALIDIKKAINISKMKEAKYFYLLGDIYFILKNPDFSLKAYEKAYNIDNDKNLFDIKKSIIMKNKVNKNGRKKRKF